MKKNFRQHRPLFTPPSSQKPKIKWRILPIIWLALKRTAMALGFLMLINAVIAVVILSSARKGAHEVPMLPQKDIVLYMGFEDGFQELPKEISFLDGFEEPSLTVNEIVDTLDHAARDPRVTGLVARMRGGSFGLSATQDVRAALKRFREAGKFAYIYSSSYGDGGGGLGRYYLASAFDEIWMQPLGVVSVAGISAEMPFMREGLDKLGIRPQFFQRKDYKTAYESLTNKSISPENKEMTRQLINDIRSVILADVPADRGMSPAAFEKLVDKGLLTAKEAQEAGLVTHVDYGDVLLEKVAEEVTGEPKAENLDLVYMEDYRDGIASEIHKGRKGKVALIYALGAIVPSADGGGAFDGGSHVAAADEIAPAILKASRDNKVKAIILRIDSPGGSPTASESILRAVERAQGRGKKVIVSMGDAAASGGYWISAYADHIFASPTTLTGSIGVVGGKFAIEDLSKKLGVNWEKISWGKNAGIWSINTPFNASETERMNAMLDQIYDSFIERVAKGRKMEPEAVDKIAGGRVWTGKRALEIGLVDELGSLSDAQDYVARMLGGQDRRDIDIEIFPKPKTAIEQLMELLGGQVAMGPEPDWASKAKILLQPYLQAVDMGQNPQNYLTYEPLRLE